MYSWIILLFAIIPIILIVLAVILFRSLKEDASKIYSAGLKEYNADKYAQSVNTFKRALEAKPGFSDAKFMLGCSYYMLEKYQSAIQCYMELLQKGVEDYDTYFNLALALQMEKSYSKAIDMYAKALGYNAQSIDSYCNLGRIKFAQKNYKEALEDLKKANSIIPNRADVLFLQNRCHDELSDPDNLSEYEKIINKYIEISDMDECPDQLPTAFAISLSKAGRIIEADAKCKEALRTDSKSGEPHKIMGLLQLVQRNLNSARDHLKKSIEIDSSDPETYNLLAYACMNAGDQKGFMQYRKDYETKVAELNLR